MAEHEVLMSVSIDARRRNIELTTLQRGKGRHTHYASIKQAPPELRGEALGLIRQALLASGYTSLAELESALTAELVVPDKSESESAEGPAATRPKDKTEEQAATGSQPAKTRSPAAPTRRKTAPRAESAPATRRKSEKGAK